MASEKRLIDADAEIEAIKTCACKDCESYNGIRCRTCWADDLINWIEDAPKVDAVEVVRCKDCKNAMLFRRPEGKLIADCLIRKMNSEDEQFCMVGADDFCSYGERKGNE